ncbi:extracellular solute-binding protein [Humitalea sp. 24SJ18S-53]|uniref:extracellular solute-binding protein n=1 Tax=Humitalea sp. 24SJ18S-53 TaxID=3422307 RepID=UPI003D66E7AA
MNMQSRCEHLIERHGNGDLGRRGFLGLLGMAAASVGLAGAGIAGLTRHAQAADGIRFDGWGGVAQQAMDRLVLRPFTEKTGTAVRQGSFGSMEELLTKVRAGSPGDYNLASLNTRLAYKQFYDFGLCEAVDETRIPRLATMDRRAIDGFKILSDGKLCAVPSILTTVGILYNRDLLPSAEVAQKGADILLDSRFRGKISGENNWLKRIWYGALQTGQNPNAIANMDAVWDKIRQSRQMVIKYWSSGAEQMSLLANGTAVVSDGWGVRAFHLRKQGFPIDIAFPNGIYTDTGGILVLKGTPMDAAYEMFDILLRPEVQFVLAEDEGNTPLYDPTKVEIPASLRANLPGYDENGTLRLGTFVDPVYWTQNAIAWQRRYQQVMARG